MVAIADNATPDPVRPFHSRRRGPFPSAPLDTNYINHSPIAISIYTSISIPLCSTIHPTLLTPMGSMLSSTAPEPERAPVDASTTSPSGAGAPPAAGGPPVGGAPGGEPPAPHSRPTVDTLPPAAIELAGRLFNAARAGNTAELEEYVAAGIPVNLTNGTGDTLLMLAAYHGHAETVAALLARGADADALNDKGQAPIAGAVFKGHDAVVKVLFEAGANIDAGHPSARACAVMFKKQELVELFESRK